MNSRQRRKVRREHYAHCKNFIASSGMRRLWSSDVDILNEFIAIANRDMGNGFTPRKSYGVIIDDPPDVRKNIKLPELQGMIDHVYERSMLAYKRILGVSDE